MTLVLGLCLAMLVVAFFYAVVSTSDNYDDDEVDIDQWQRHDLKHDKKEDK